MPPNLCRISAVAAMSENRVIGRGADLPWSLPDEMAQFRAFTLGHAVIMGRRTFAANGGKPLPHRDNLVLSRDPHFEAPGVTAFTEFNAAIDSVRDRCEVFVAGGAEIYRQALPRLDRIYLTTVHAELRGDVFFPVFDEAAWTVTDARYHPADARHDYAFTVRTLDRTPGPG